MRFGLPESAIARICAVFAAHPEIEKAVLYGSRAKGNFKPGSDIDLLFILPETPIELACQIAERVRTCVERIRFDFTEGITISIGLARYQCGESYSHTLNRADKALRQAKTLGRNRVEVF